MNKFNMKKIVMWISIVVFCAFLIAGISLYNQRDKFSGNWDIEDLDSNINKKYSENINDEENFAINDVSKITIKTVSSDINIIITKEDSVRAHYHGKYVGTLKKAPYLQGDKTGNTIKFEIKYPKVVLGLVSIKNDAVLDIYLPEKYREDISVDTVSGELEAEKIELNEFKFSAVSGDLDMDNLITNKTRIEGTSSKINISQFVGDIEGETVSGDLSIGFEEFLNDIDFDTVSGDVEIKLPSQPNFELIYETVSGDIKNDYPIKLDSSKKTLIEGIVGSGNNKINVETVSGNLRLLEK
ncbi:hypothetical protein SH2C18_43380 [Clostridium sediminicola]|uniref:DUF4097 family beta strand repeat-containing protein n=1 Tax=Clostridium sediminicola TaxID=3114879 RepID=UPI0031F21232